MNPFPPSRPPREAVAGAAMDRSVALQSLEAQASLLPYALAFFGVALPIFTWACSFAADRWWMTASFVIFALNWAAFYAQIDWMRRNPERRAASRNPSTSATKQWVRATRTRGANIPKAKHPTPARRAKAAGVAAAASAAAMGATAAATAETAATATARNAVNRSRCAITSL